MQRISWLILAKGIELLLLATLIKEYGGAHSLKELLKHFEQQPELSQIGTITAVIVVVGVFAATVEWMFCSLRDCLIRLIQNTRSERQPKQDEN